MKPVYIIPDKARVVRHSELRRLLAKASAAEVGRMLGLSKETIFREAKKARLLYEPGSARDE